jgi:O-antigen/teichoic acid export membrane protein
MEKFSHPQSLKAQSAWLLLAKIIGFIFAFILPLLVVRLLSQDQVGVYRLSFLVIVNASEVLPLGFSMSAYYFLNREKEKRRAAILNILLFNFVVGGLACVTLIFFPNLLGSIFQSAEMARLAPKIGIVIWIWIISTFLETVAIANQETKLATFFIIFAQFSKTFLMVSAVVFFATVDAFLYAAIIQGAMQTAILLYYLNSRFPYFWRGFSFSFFREQMFYAVPFGLAGILWVLQTDIHNYFVGYRFSEAEFAIYSYGCFQIPLIGMLLESVSAVLIPRMTELQSRGNREEMVRLMVRSMQKLAFFYFPTYVFLLITAQTFIITLFTKNYLAAVPIFMINLTILPFQVLLTDPIVRAFRELGKFLLSLRIFLVSGLILTLFWGVRHFDLRGMIAIAVIFLIIEKVISGFIVMRKLGFGWQDLALLKNIGKTAFASLIAGIITFGFYTVLSDFVFSSIEEWIERTFDFHGIAFLNFLGGSVVLLLSALIFVPVYIFCANYSGIIEDDEKAFFYRGLSVLGNFLGFRNKTVG